MKSERGFFGRCSLFSLKSQAFDTGNSIHQALGRLHFESTGSENSPAKGFLIHWELTHLGRRKTKKKQKNTNGEIQNANRVVWD